MAYFVAKLFATASMVLLPITKLYIDYYGPVYTETEERIGVALVAYTLLCVMGTIITIVWAILP